LLQAPDLLGHPSALSLAAVAPEVVKNALRLKKIGNEILRAIGGRSVHPVSACVGGFYKWPKLSDLQALLSELEWALQTSIETVRWSATLPYPELEVDYDFVALHREDEYAILDGEILSSKRGSLPVESYAETYLESHVPHSNALHSHTAEGGTYLVGPLARLNLNHDHLGAQAKEILADIGIQFPLCNPYKSLIARAVELVETCELAIELIRSYQPQGSSKVDLELKPGSGCAATEAPRGLLYHSYEVDAGGLIQKAHIVPPTAQNLPRIEADLRLMAPKVVAMPLDQATLTCEHLVRAYDPCISCATHFLKLEITETSR
jgi:coenzyme F420-reducing hydrogenase alpha subunit